MLNLQNVDSVLESVLASDNSQHVLSALLDQKIALPCSGGLLLGWLDNILDKASCGSSLV